MAMAVSERPMVSKQQVTTYIKQYINSLVMKHRLPSRLMGYEVTMIKTVEELATTKAKMMIFF